MAMGKPVVATAVGGNPELVIDGKTGFLVTPKSPEKMAEAIARIVEGRDRAQEMSLAARKRAESLFSMECMVDKTTALYGCLLDLDHRPPRPASHDCRGGQTTDHGPQKRETSRWAEGR